MDYENQGLPSSTPVSGTQAVERAARLLREIAASRYGSCSLAELATRLDLERPTAYRILRRLVVEGLVAQDPATRSYELGPLLYELGLAVKPPQDLQRLADKVLGRLALESGDTVFAIVQRGMDSVCIDRREGDYPVKALLMNPGRRRPMGIGSGSLALLAAMPEEKSDQILDLNATRLAMAGEADTQALRANVKRCRRDGFLAHAATEVPEILSLAIAVCNSYGTPVLALSISALRFRIESRQDLLVTLLQDARRMVENEM